MTLTCKYCKNEVKMSNSSPVWQLSDPTKGYELACHECTKDIPCIGRENNSLPSVTGKLRRGNSQPQ